MNTRPGGWVTNPPTEYRARQAPTDLARMQPEIRALYDGNME